MNALKKKLKEAQNKANDYAFEKKGDQSKAETPTSPTPAAEPAPAGQPSAVDTAAPAAAPAVTSSSDKPAEGAAPTGDVEGGAVDPGTQDPTSPRPQGEEAETFDKAVSKPQEAAAQPLPEEGEPEHVETRGNGTVIKTFKDGRKVTTYPDGKVHNEFADGSSTTTWPDGRTTHYTPSVKKADPMDKGAQIFFDVHSVLYS